MALSFPGVVLLVPQLHSVLTWLVLSQGWPNVLRLGELRHGHQSGGGTKREHPGQQQ